MWEQKLENDFVRKKSGLSALKPKGLILRWDMLLLSLFVPRICATHNPALGSSELPLLETENKRAPPYVIPLPWNHKAEITSLSQSPPTEEQAVSGWQTIPKLFFEGL